MAGADELHVPMGDVSLDEKDVKLLTPRESNYNPATLRDGSCSTATTPRDGNSGSKDSSLNLNRGGLNYSKDSLGKESRSSQSYSMTSDSHSSEHSPTSKNSGYLNDYTDIEASVSRRRNSLETVDTSLTVELNYSFLDKYAKLIEVERIPWAEQEVLSVLREGRPKEYSGQVTVEIMQRLCYILQRPLVRIANEAMRLSQTFCRCGRDEIHSAMKIVLSRELAESCLLACHKATALYAMSSDSFKESKSARCGLRFSVGKFQRWMIDAGIALRINEFGAIYFTACIENLLEEIVLIALGKQEKGTSPFTIDDLDYGIASNAELWGLLQPYQHLICGRTSTGSVSLPNSVCLDTNFDPTKGKVRRNQDHTNPMGKNMEQSLLATCVGSLAELGDLVSKATHTWFTKNPNRRGSGAGVGSVVTAPKCALTWSREALQVLYYYMKCSQLEHADDPNLMPPSLHVCHERPYSVLPPLVEWVRVCTAHTEHRCGWVIDGDDVHQAARLLLPEVDCPPRQISPETSMSLSRYLDAYKCTQKFRQDMAFQMIATGRSDILPDALALLGPERANTISDQGLTPLMYACIYGDEAMVQMLLDSGALLDLPVPNEPQRYPCVRPEIRNWTALTFATLRGHLSVAQLLLEKGACVEAAVKSGEDNYSETPLQLAAAAGHYELVSLLLTYGADPYLNTIQKNGVSYTYSRGGYSAFALAAAHGHRNVLRKLLSAPVGDGSVLLSLEEILAEGNADTLRSKYIKTNEQKVHESGSECDLGNELDIDVEEEEEMKENDYVTIEEVIYEDSRLHNQAQLVCPFYKLTKGQTRSLQESLYHAAENGFLDIALELRNMGVSWSLHTWGQCLSAAYNMRRKTIIQCLLKDFGSVNQDLETNQEFIYDILPLMLDILKNTRNEMTCRLLAELFYSFYGTEPVTPIQELKTSANARIDPKYVNNPELSDIQFMIEGKIFYAHKIILVNASNRFRAMLSNKWVEGKQNCVEINDVHYHIFEYIMKYLYNGSAENIKVSSQDIMELMAASNFYMLDGLQRHCEKLCSSKITFENCVAIYKHAKLYSAIELLGFCESYFLRHLKSLVLKNEEYRRLLYSSKSKGINLIQGLLVCLQQRMEARKTPPAVPPVPEVTSQPEPVPRPKTPLIKPSQLLELKVSPHPQVPALLPQGPPSQTLQTQKPCLPAQTQKPSIPQTAKPCLTQLQKTCLTLTLPNKPSLPTNLASLTSSLPLKSSTSPSGKLGSR